MAYQCGGGWDPDFSPTVPLMCCVFSCASTVDTLIPHNNRLVATLRHVNCFTSCPLRIEVVPALL